MCFEWSSLGSLLATLFFIRSLIMEFMPPLMLSQLNEAMCACLTRTRRMSIVIEEFDVGGYSDTFHDMLRYLSHKFSSTATVVKVSDSTTVRGYSSVIDVNQILHDKLDDVKASWRFHVKDSSAVAQGSSRRVRCLELTYDRAINQRVRYHYIPIILEVRQRARKLYTNSSSGERGSLWSSVAFSHPSTFETLAMESKLKSAIMKDLTSFLTKEDYYKRVGKGYLLYGPPGTGKTSLVAAMANFLDFDVYDLEQTAVASDSQLRRLLLETKRKSVIVIEDVDRTISLINGKQMRGNINGDDEWEEGDRGNGGGTKGGELSPSGILNFMGGLWSCCGEGKVMVVTTNHKEKPDPSLLRPGRLDVHINLSYCGVEALRTLTANYLGLDGERGEWEEVEALLAKAKVTPATVAEVLLGSESTEMARLELTNLLSQELKKP